MTDDRSSKFETAIQRFDDANAKDPNVEIVDGTPQPREQLFARRVYAWIEKLVHTPSTDLLLAARAHTLKRWEIPRDRYPMTTIGYHEWRTALAVFHAEHARSILEDVGLDENAITRIEELIVRKRQPTDPEARALEDADCLVFLETKLQNYTDEWDDDKTLRILRGTWRKMSQNARHLAATLSLGPRERKLIDRAIG